MSAAIIVTMLITLLALPSMAFAQLTVNTAKNHIKIRALYHGDTVSLSGRTDPGADLVIKIASTESATTLRQKGKVGFFWLNTVKLKFAHVPHLYLLYSSHDPKNILEQAELDKYIIGYPSLGKHASITPVKDESEKTKWFNEFIKFKEASGLYGINLNSISITQKGGQELYNINIDWPYQIPPGDYKATVYEIKDGKVVGKADTGISVKQDGLVKIIADMASKNGAMYGIMSIIIALVVGFAIGLIFKKS